MALALCWAGLLTVSSTKAQDIISLSPGSIYETGNVVQQTGYGGPSSWVNGVYQDQLTCWAWGDPGYCGPNAIVRPGNNINFSFGTTDLYQRQAVSSLLPAGSGLQVNGYNFSFTAKNGNGWDDGRVDQLSAYVTFSNTDGSVAYSKNTSLNYQFNWTTFNLGETFSSPLLASKLKDVQYGFVGRDNNFWAGPYGPEVYNVNFSLKYSINPCVTNPLSSPTCPGFKDALAKLSSSSTYSAPTTTSSTGSVTSPTAMADPIKNDTSSSNVGGGLQVSSTGEISVATDLPQFIRSANDLEVKEKEKQITRAVLKPVEATVVVRKAQPQQDVMSFIMPSFTASETANQQDFWGPQAKLSSVTTSRRADINADLAAANSSSSSNQSTLSVGPTNLLNMTLGDKPVDTSTGSTGPATTTVKRDVQNNELAGGVDLSKMSIQPIGFSDYLNLALTDSAFYAPKEVYKNQRVVDNARAQRLLQGASDRMHQEMINSQYKTGR